MENHFTSRVHFERALNVIPGGVNSPVRAFKGVGGRPLFIERGQGPYIFDIDGRRYIDYVGSWGPLILGHASGIVSGALQEIIERGTSFGAPTILETEFAELVVELVPSVQMLRVMSSGTEATMTAVRLARGCTGRKRLLKFDGCYHGHADIFLVQAGSGVATCGISGSPGVPDEIANLTTSIEYNNLELFEACLERLGPETIAAVIVEPVAGNMGLVLPKPDFLDGLRRHCSAHGIVLIFDEVMSGFRVGLGGAGERFGVTPDLVTLGKVIGGGLPVGALGGRREIMEQLAPSGSVYQAGTLSGNPLAMAAGIAVLKHLRDANPYPGLEQLAEELVEGIRAAAFRHGVSISACCCGSMFGMFFSDKPVSNFSQAGKSDTERFARFFHSMLDQGVYLAPSAFEAGFLSTEHSSELIAQTIEAAEKAFAGQSAVF